MYKGGPPTSENTISLTSVLYSMQNITLASLNCIRNFWHCSKFIMDSNVWKAGEDLRLYTWWQTYHDPDCGAMGFKSNNVKLPEELCAEVSDSFFKQGLCKNNCFLLIFPLDYTFVGIGLWKRALNHALLPKHLQSKRMPIGFLFTENTEKNCI